MQWEHKHFDFRAPQPLSEVEFEQRVEKFCDDLSEKGWLLISEVDRRYSGIQYFTGLFRRSRQDTHFVDAGQQVLDAVGRLAEKIGSANDLKDPKIRNVRAELSEFLRRCSIVLAADRLRTEHPTTPQQLLGSAEQAFTASQPSADLRGTESTPIVDGLPPAKKPTPETDEALDEAMIAERDKYAAG